MLVPPKFLITGSYFVERSYRTILCTVDGIFVNQIIGVPFKYIEIKIVFGIILKIQWLL